MTVKTRNGAEYFQNYDFVVRQMAAALRDRTLKVLGIQTGTIKEVFGFEPVNLAVKTGRMDVIARDDAGWLYHIEEQRNLCRADMYRFASQHFNAAEQWNDSLTDIVLASGKPYTGPKEIVTQNGSYKPRIIDFTERNGPQRLQEIKDGIRAGLSPDPMELVFLPLYGNAHGKASQEFVEQVISFEIDLHHAGRFPDTLLAATLIMSNKIITKDQINAIWEEIKMLDIIEVAMEKGRDEGLIKGRNEGLEKGRDEGLNEGLEKGRDEGLNEGLEKGRTAGFQDMLMDAIVERFNVLPLSISERIQNIRDAKVLQALFRQTFRCQDLKAFESVLNQV